MCYEKIKENPRSLNASKKKQYRHPENCCTEVWTTALSGCGRSCGIRPSTGRQTSTAATPLRMPRPRPASGRKGTHPAAEEETAGAAAEGRRSCCRCHRAKAFCYQGKRYHFCRAAAAERCGAWTAAGAPERRAKGRQGQGKRYLYRRTDRDTGHSGSGTATAGAESIHGGTRAQSCPMAGRAKASRIAPPNQDGTSLTFRQGR